MRVRNQYIPNPEFLPSTLMNRSIDCKKMLMPRARRKTPLKKAPRRRARCQPKERSWRALALSEIYMIISGKKLVNKDHVCKERGRLVDWGGGGAHDLGCQGDHETNEVIQLSLSQQDCVPDMVEVGWLFSHSGTHRREAPARKS